MVYFIRKSQHYLPFVLFLILLCGVWGMHDSVRSVLSLSDRNIVMGDLVDTPLIMKGLEITPTFTDTLHWWTGPWIQGKNVAFYRPLTSLIWWSEYQIFGADGLIGFMSVHFISHLIVLFIAFFFLRELLGVKVAAVSTCIFAIHTPLLFFGLPSSSWALEMWKDDPEMWGAIMALLALWSFLKGIKNESRWWMLTGCACFIVGITIKESAYVIPFLFLLLLWYKKKVLPYRHWAISSFIIAAIAFAFRWWALGGGGFRFGTNGSWFHRWMINVIGGASAAELVRGYYVPLAIVCGIISLFWGISGRSRWWQAGFACIAIMGLWISGNGLDGPPYYLLIGNVLPWVRALYLLAYIALIWRFVICRQRGQLFGWLWVLVVYLPLMTAPITQHALYFVALGWSIWFAYALIDIVNITKKAFVLGLRTVNTLQIRHALSKVFLFSSE